MQEWRILMQTPAVWNRRWNALAEILEHMKRNYKNPTFSAMSLSLKTFGDGQFKFFVEGFKNGSLLLSFDFPPENIYRATLDQVAYDITAIQQAVDQRGNGFSKMKKSLAIADALTQNSLNLGIDSKLIEPAAVISYFLKSSNIRVIPYAPVAIVGVPYTCLTTVRDYLATPHEVGHYIYHNGAIASDLYKLLPGMPEWGAGWLEEIFADVYGCLVAGPVIGLDFEDLLNDNDQERFISSDGHHPVDAIRPYIYIKTLKELGFVNAAEALKKRWLEILAQRGNPQSFYPDDEYGEVPMKLAKKFVKKTAVTILEYLKKRGVPTNKTWTQDLPAPETPVDELYKAFADKLDDLANTKLNTLQADINKDIIFVKLPDDDKKYNQRKIGDTQTWIDWAKEQSSNNPTEPLPFSVWNGIFNAGGWPIKGPECSGTGGAC